MSARRRFRIGAVGALLLLGLAAAAWAYFTAIGTGSGTAGVGGLSTPDPVVATTPSVGVAHVTWHVVPDPTGGSDPVTYTVDRSTSASGPWTATSGPTCAGTLPTGTTSCNDSPAAGTYFYRVTAHYRTFTSSGVSGSVTVVTDVTPPTSVITFPTASASYNSAGWTAGCGTPGSDDICGMASDNVGGSGVQKVEISLRQESSNLFWDGFGFNSASEVFIVAPGAANWSYAFASTNFPTDGQYRVRSRATDNASNIETTPQSVTFTIDRVAPTVSSINRVTATPTNATSVQWTVTFSESVSGVDSTDFSLANSGLTSPSITSVIGGPTVYTVTANTGSGDGTLGLNLVDNDSIIDAANNPLGGSGAGNGNFTGQVYTIDKTAPTVSSITLAGTSPTNAASVSWTVTFSEPVSGVTASNFTLVNGGLGGTPAITSVSGTAPTATWTVTASTGSGDGTLGLNKTSNSGVTDTAGNALTGANVTGGVYTIDRAAPTVTSIVIVGSTPTNAASVSWTVTFSEPVSGATASNFTLVNGGLGGTPAITSVSGTAPTATWTVTASTGSGDGTLGLNKTSNSGVTDTAGNALTGANVTGSVYTIDRTAPTVSSINRATSSPTNASSVQWTVTFSESVTGVSASNFTLVNGGLGGTPAITNVTGGGSAWTVTASTGSGDGTLGLNKTSNAGVTDTAGNALTGADVTGQVYSIDRTAPTVTSIVIAGSTPTNAASVSWTVTFSEPVNGVTASNFTLVNGGLGGTPAITSVTGPGPTATWTVTASTGSGDGTLGLNKTSNAGVTDVAGNALTGGNVTGGVYTVDHVAPTVSSITLAGSSPTNAASVSWTVTFSEPVSGVTVSNFTLVNGGLGGTPAITAVSGTAPTATWTVTASTGSGDGTLGLNKTSNAGVTDPAGNALTGANVTGSVYTIDRTAPTVSTITLAGSSPTNAASVSWTVTFSEPVNGVTASNFTLVNTGLGGTPAITSVTGPGPTATWIVTASTGSGNGTLGLNKTNNTGVTDTAGNTLTGANVTGSVYTIDRTAPTVTSLVLQNKSGNTAGTIEKGDSIIVTFSKTMKVSSLCSTWSGDGSDQSLTVNNDVTITVHDGTGAANDSITVTSGTCTFNFGSINLGNNNYASGGDSTFSGSGNSGNKSTINWTASTHVLTIVLGAASGGSLNNVTSSNAVYTPSVSVTDSAGNTVTGTASTGNIKNF